MVSSAIVDKYIGESARLIREMFNYARDHQVLKSHTIHSYTNYWYFFGTYFAFGLLTVPAMHNFYG